MEYCTSGNKAKCRYLLTLYCTAAGRNDIFVSVEIVQSYIEEFTYQAPYDTTNWTSSPIKQFTYKTSELNPKNGTDEKMASFIVQIIAEELK